MTNHYWHGDVCVHCQECKRKESVQLFLAYRGSNCRERELWSAILDENFTLTLPITPYRSFPRREILGSSRVVRGIEAVMADCCSLALMAESIGLGSNAWRYAIKRCVFFSRLYSCYLWPHSQCVHSTQNALFSTDSIAAVYAANWFFIPCMSCLGMPPARSSTAWSPPMSWPPGSW